MLNMNFTGANTSLRIPKISFKTSPSMKKTKTKDAINVNVIIFPPVLVTQSRARNEIIQNRYTLLPYETILLQIHVFLHIQFGKIDAAIFHFIFL